MQYCSHTCFRYYSDVVRHREPAFLAGEPCRLEGEAEWLERSGIAFRTDAVLAVRVAEAPSPIDAAHLVGYRGYLDQVPASAGGI